MNKICTSPEQSRRLIELGIDVNTADMWWAERYKGRTTMDFQYIVDEEPYYYLSFIKPSNDNYSQDTIKDISAWSLSALMKLLPSEFTTENKFGKHKYEIKIRKYKLTDNVDIHQIAYGNYKWYEDGSNSWKDMINTGEKEELLDAAFEMICWLKENNKI